MDAVVLAGGIPSPEDPLYNYTQGRSKALVDIAGAPMVQWVLNALGGAISVDHVLVVGLDQDCGLTCAKPLVKRSWRLCPCSPYVEKTAKAYAPNAARG